MDIVEYLESKGLTVKPGGSDNIRVLCPFHDEEEGKAGRLYINVEDGEKYGVGFCFRCNWKGNINSIRRHFGDKPIEEYNNRHEYDPIMEQATQYYHDKLFENYEAFMYIEDRAIPESSILRARLGWADGGLGTHLLQKGWMPEQLKNHPLFRIDGSDYFNNQIIFPYMIDGVVQQLRGKAIGGKTISLKGVSTLPYNIDSIRGEKTVALTEGEVDALSLEALGYNVVGIPGVHSFKEDWLAYIEDAKRIYILFDQDNAGKSGAEKVAQLIGPRARIVELPKKGIDVNDFIVKMGKTRDDFEFLFSKAKGGLLVSVTQAFEQWSFIEGNPQLAGRKFNIKEFDDAMTFGLLPGQVMTMIARSNSGKSVSTINHMHRMRMQDPEFKVLFFSLEQTRNEWFERAHRIHNFYQPGASPIDTVNYWKDNIQIVDKNRINETQLIDCIEQFAYEVDQSPDLVVVDYLGYYAKGMPGANEKEKVSDAIMGMKSIAKEFQTVFLAPHQANRTGDLGRELTMDMAKDAATVEETSDLMLSLWNPSQEHIIDDENRGEAGIIYQRILKARDSGVGTVCKYAFSPLTLALVPSSDPLYDRAVYERTLAATGHTWRDAVERYQTNSKEI